MSLTGARKPRWSYMLLNSEDEPLGALDGVSGGSLEVNANSRLGGSASLTIDERGQGIDWLTHRVKVTYDPGTGDDAWGMGVWQFTSPTTTTDDAVTTHSVELLSKMAAIDEDSVADRYSLAAGTQIIPAVLTLIRSTGETRIAATDSDATLTNPMVWEAAESKLTIINDLLEAAGYWSLWCDGEGQFRVEPYTPPGDRPTSWVFEAGEAAIHESGWSREQDLSAIPNRFVVVGQGDEETPALVGVAQNDDPESPFSTVSRGRVITRSEEGVEGTQQVLDQLAERRLRDAMSPVASLNVTHAILPLDPNDVVDFFARGHSARATVQKMTYQMSFEGQCVAEWREL